ncbi:MAG: response regulator [Desulfobacterales bacterium]|nr:response regulator [Desulfobacterales bacterium]
MSEKKKILVVEDESDVSTYLTTLFEDNGYDTVTAEDGVEGLDTAKAEKPDLITLDIAMPEQSGVRTYRQYKTEPETKDIPVIIITGIGESMETYLKKLSGFADPEGFMSKPIDRDELLKMVSDILSE